MAFKSKVSFVHMVIWFNSKLYAENFEVVELTIWILMKKWDNCHILPPTEGRLCFWNQPQILATCTRYWFNEQHLVSIKHHYYSAIHEAVRNGLTDNFLICGFGTISVCWMLFWDWYWLSFCKPSKWDQIGTDMGTGLTEHLYEIGQKHVPKQGSNLACLKNQRKTTIRLNLLGRNNWDCGDQQYLSWPTFNLVWANWSETVPKRLYDGMSFHRISRWPDLTCPKLFSPSVGF